MHDLTDHLPVLVCTDFQRFPKSLNKTPVLIRDTSKFQTASFAEDLLDNLSSLVDISNAYNANQCITDFINTFKTTLDTHAPLRKQTRKEKKLRSKPWITKGLLMLIKHKNKLYAHCTVYQRTQTNFMEKILKVQKQANSYKRTSKEKIFLYFNTRKQTKHSKIVENHQ